MTDYNLVYKVSSTGVVGVYVCDLCGQPLAPGDECNSGLHVGPAGRRGKKGQAVLTTDLAVEAVKLKRECPFDTDKDGNCGQRYCPYCGTGR